MQSNAYFMLMLVALGAGIASAMQSTMNGALGRAIGDPVAAALWSFLSGSAVMLVIYGVKGGNLSLDGIASAPPWSLLGGALGAAMVLGVAVAAPQIGLLTTLCAVVLGQALTALVLDAVGIWGEPQGITATRLVAVSLMLAGFWASRQ
jgi:bacterial/archaeal transporter family-2 protein